MFSYVAKSLLSKTLRTFLRKYLENIELESIDYGSSTSAASADSNTGKSQNGSSGWGVRLSNVKLREGMELMKLPGKRKRVVRKKKKVRRNKSTKSSADNDLTPITKNSKRAIQLDEGVEKVTQSKESIGVPGISGCEKDNITVDAAPSIDGGKGRIIFQPEVAEQIRNRDRLQSSDTENGYFSSGPSTPTQSRHALCGVHSPFCLNGKKVIPQKETIKVPIPFDIDHLSKSDMPATDGIGESSDADESTDGNTNGEPNARPASNVPASTDEHETQQSSTDQSNVFGLGDDDEDSYMEVEEEVLVEDDLALVVGAGGAIGTLNIRLVGKELHVTVEDAHLVVEAVPSESISDVGNKRTKNPESKKPNLDRSTSSSSEADLPSLVDENADETTMGEKIKKKSMLARFLSMIPHLFLRDCRVSLILPEEMGDDDSSTDSCDDCTIFELGIDFLSVTSGDDFLDVLRFDTGNQSSEAPTPKPKSFSSKSAVPSEKQTSNSKGKHYGRLNSQTVQNNIFSRKRIRTGKGPNGGVWLKILPPLGSRVDPPRMKYPSEPKWARRYFLDASESFFLRFSGIDIHARMLVDTVQENEDDEIGDVWSNNAYEEYTMDSMLFGVDYVDPISLTRHQIRKEMISKLPADELSDVMSDTDTNGIQSIPFASNLHWIAQRVHCSDCTNTHLPLNDCFFCWNACVQQKHNSPMSNFMPLPGFVFYLSMTDSLEVNVDRGSLKALGYMKTLFTSQKQLTEEEKENVQQETNANANTTDLGKDINKEPSEASPCFFDDKSFPIYMQPDAIYLTGFHVAKVIVRVEAIESQTDSGLKFRFWQLIGQSIQYEESQVDSEEQFLRDVTFHVSTVECKDFFGVCEKNLFAAGIDDVGTISGEPHGSDNAVQLPCTASCVLGVSTSAAFEKQSNISHAVHARLIQSYAPKEVEVKDTISTSKVGYVNLRVGMVDVDVKNTLWSDISKTSSRASSILFNGTQKVEQSKPETPKPKPKGSSKWLCHISTTGGTLSYQPRIKMKIPESKVQMRRGPEGLSFETFLHRLGMEYGSYSFDKPQAPSIIPLCLLPESLRMHILMYLDNDLPSLEEVLNIKHTKKKKPSVFLRHHAVNKKLSLLGVSSKQKKKSYQAEAIRRKNALARLQSLDIDSLEAMLARHNGSHNT